MLGDGGFGGRFAGGIGKRRGRSRSAPPPLREWGASGRRLRRGLAALAIALVGTAPLLAAAPPAGASATASRPAPAFARVGTAPRLPAGASVLHAVAGSEEVRVDLVMQPRDAAALAAYANAVSSPKSNFYRHYLAPSEIGQTFAPTSAQQAFVSATLRGEGLTVGTPTDQGFVVPVTARAATMERAFRTNLLAVRLPDGSLGRIATSAPALPAAIAPSVAAVIGLDNLLKPTPLGLQASPVARHGAGSGPLSGARPAKLAIGAHRAAPGTAGTGGPGTCAAASKIAAEAAAYTPDEIAKAYGFDGLYKAGELGAGQTIDLFELDPFQMSDVVTYDKCIFGVSHASQVKQVNVDGGLPQEIGGGEAALDIDLVSALAPGANIDVYEAPFGVTVVPVASWIDEIAAIVSQDNASVVSMSYGFCESFGNEEAPGLAQAENVLFEQAALEGQSWFVASGDTGSETCNRDTGSDALSVADPTSQPFVTSVGGTTLLAATDPPSEKVWNDGGIAGQGNNGGGGGGISANWQMPAWQSGLSVPGVENSYTSGAPCSAPTGVDCREVPDVSASADQFHGDPVLIGGFWNVFGGTSAAAPKWAAVAALTNATCEAQHSSEIGFANPALYQIASNPTSYSEAFNDVTIGNNDVTGDNHGAYPATPGYDMASGLGTPQVTSPSGGPGLASLLCADGERFSPRPSLSSVSPTFGPYQGGTAVTISGTDLTGVTAVNFGASVVPVTPGDINGGGTQISVVTPASTFDPNPPAGPVGGVVVTVAGSGGTSEPTPLAEFHFVDEVSSSPVPTVSYVGPSAGNAAGGTHVHIIGSGFEEGLTAGTKPTVDFGGAMVPSADVDVVSDSVLSVITPHEPPASHCATYPAVAESNICQVEVTVSNLNGTSATVPILPAPTGSTEEAQPPNTELVAAATEFDYAPTPKTTSISPTQLPQFPNFFGPPPILTVNGSGFNFLTLVGVLLGSGTSASNDTFLTEIEPDQIQVDYLGFPGFLNGDSFPVSVETSGGTSNAQTAEIVQPPELDSISVHDGSDGGGTTVSATGSGFTSSGDSMEFVAVEGQIEFVVSGTQNVTDQSPTKLTFVTPSSLALPGYFEVCNLGGCSFLISPAIAFTYYEPVPPVVTSMSPTSGRASGGGFALFTGTGLGNVVSVRFGNALSPDVGNPQVGGQGSVSENDTTAFAEIPPGPAGARVPVTLTTFAGKTSSLSFTYTKSAPAAPAKVTALPGAGSISVSWTPSSADGGSPIEHYVVSAVPLGGRIATAEVAPSVHKVVLAPLSPGVGYKVSVAVVNAVGQSTTTLRSEVTPTLGDNGYVIVGKSGYEAGFGSLNGAPSGLAGQTLPGPIAGIAGTPDGEGFWLAGADGSVYPLGTAHQFGSLAGKHLGAPIVGIAATPDGKGYWLVGSDGGVFAFGDARFHGSMGGKHLAAPIVAIGSSSDGAGYWLVAGDGGVFTFGDARFHGSMGGKHLVAPIVSVMVDATGHGYWLVAADGGVFSFGDAKYHGSLGGTHLAAPIDAAQATPDGNGYWLLAANGAVYALGSAHYEGGAEGLLGGSVGAIGL